jgi:hypothetical protein
MEQQNTSTNKDDIYFAAKSAEDCASVLVRKGDSFYNTLRSNAFLDKLNSMWRAYHGAYGGDVGSGHQINFTGEQGELTTLPVNHFRNLAQHMFVMITSNRPIMESRAVNGDYKSLAQTYLANGILDYYMREKKLEDCIKKATEMAIVLGAGFIKLEWNATAGESYDHDEETGEFVYEGEVEFSNLSPLDVVVDGTKESWNNDWIMVRTFKNKYDLVAKYPELADKIKGIPSKSQDGSQRLAIFSNDETDDIPVYEFYHRKTESMPDGRYMLFCSAEVVLLDTKMPYRRVPIFRIAPSDIMGTPYGYTPMFDVFPIQEGINSLYSTIMTNQAAFGVQNLWVQRGADINVNNLEGGMNIIEGNSKPEPLNLTATPKEIFDFLEKLIESAETISGVNSVARGNPQASLKSGTALALVQSMALQFISGLQQSYVKLIEDVGTSLIEILKDFAHTPKVIALVGKNNRTYLKEFTGEQISDIARVVVDVGNPLSRTIAGRVQMAEQMLQMQMLKTPEQYFQVIETGRLQNAYQGEIAETLNIQRENEMLLEGTPVMATMLDAHRMHIMEHKSVLADPDLRADAELVTNTLNHIQEHINYLRTTDPGLLQMIGEQPLPPIPVPTTTGENGMPMSPAPAGAPPPEGGQPPPSGQAPMSQSENGMPQPGDQITNGQSSARLPNMPNPPPPFDQLPVTPQEMV